MTETLTPELISLAESLGTICTALVGSRLILMIRVSTKLGNQSDFHQSYMHAVCHLLLFCREMKTFSKDIETHVLNNLDEKMHDMAGMIVERPELMEVIDKEASSQTPKLVFAYYILYLCAYAFHMRRRKILSDNQWEGWLRWMRAAFQDGTISESWQKDMEPGKWFDPDFQEFLDNEIIANVSSRALLGELYGQSRAPLREQ